MINLKKAGKKYKYIEHLSDTGIEFYGKTLEELFENAGEGMFSIICDLKMVEPLDRRNVRIVRKDTGLENLLVLWLEKLLYLYEIDNILFSRFKVGKIHKRNGRIILAAEIFGQKVDLNKHDIRTIIKAPTYHMLEVKKDSRHSSWEGKVIFDV